MSTIQCQFSRSGRNAGLLSVRAAARQALVAWQALGRERGFAFDPAAGEAVVARITCPDAAAPVALETLDAELAKVQLQRGAPRSFATPFPDRPGLRKARPGRS